MTGGRRRSLASLALATFALGFASPLAGASIARSPDLANRLVKIRERVLGLQERLVEGLKTQKQARENLRNIRNLMRLQREERSLKKRRMAELEDTVGELEKRRGVLHERIAVQQRDIRMSLAAIGRSVRSDSAGEDSPIDAFGLFHLPEKEKLEAPRRRLLANLVDRGLKELEAVRVDLADADRLELRIQDEKQQLANLFQDLREEQGALEFNRELQVDILKKGHAERASQLENYRKLKSAEAQVERLIGEFNARMELENAEDAERAAARTAHDADSALHGIFASLKGKLPLPVTGGRIVSSFGRGFDPRSGLYIFKKGVDIEAGKGEPVKAISGGKIAYSGDLPSYGRVAIVDHGGHFYTLCAHLGQLWKKEGDAVAAGEAIGATDDLGTPVYFEIRSRNVAVNPLQWLSN